MLRDFRDFLRCDWALVLCVTSYSSDDLHLAGPAAELEAEYDSSLDVS